MLVKSRFSIIAVIAISFYLIGGTTPAHADLGDQLFKLLPKDGAAFDAFGYSVGISGTTAIIGARLDNDNGNDSGSAYLFDITSGQQITKLLANDGKSNNAFGHSVAINGITAIVGAPYSGENGMEYGSAYLFDITTGQQLSKLLASKPDWFDSFGWSVATSGALAIVGSLGNSGPAYVFDATDGTEIAKLIQIDAPASEYGYSVAINGNIAIVGARKDNVNGENSGSAYLFDTTTGKQLFKMLPDDGEEDDWFGYSVGINDNTAIVGAIHDNDNGTGSGSAYLFDISTGKQLIKLLPDDDDKVYSFGRSIAVRGTTVVIGAYLFDISDLAKPLQISKFLPDDGDVDSGNLGWSVAISGAPGNEVVIIGRPSDDDNGNNSGSAYVFDAGICSNPNPDAVFVFDSGLPYLSEADSPFDTDSTNFTLENFEDGLFDIPGVSASGGEVRFPGAHTDSVDMDDGVLDGFGVDGHSFLQSNGQAGITFTFDSDVLQTLPSKVGLVWTDGNAQAVVSFTAKDAKGECLGFFQLVLGDDVNNGTTGEDRFLGLEFADGISSISISTSLGGIEIDHLQFVLPCPWDLDNSGSVGTSDLLELLAQWGTDGDADFDGSGAVGTADLLILFANWGLCP